MEIEWEPRGNPRMGVIAGVVVASVESAKDGTVTAWNELTHQKYTGFETYDDAKRNVDESVRETIQALSGEEI